MYIIQKQNVESERITETPAMQFEWHLAHPK